MPQRPNEDDEPAARRLSRNETHDLGMIIKERTKVLRSHAEEQAARCLVDFEQKVSKIYSYDQDEVWKRATEDAMLEVSKAQDKIDERCRRLGIPKDLSPQLALSWESRGQMKSARRRDELRRVAKSEIDAMLRAAVTKIEKQALDLRTQVVGMGLFTAEAKLFLESLAPVEEAMRSIDFGEIETKMLAQKSNLRRLGHGGLYD
jgi:hypothetical protein